MKKAIKILVSVLSLCVITFAVIKMTNPDLLGFLDTAVLSDDNENIENLDEYFLGFVETTKFPVDETDGGCELVIALCENSQVRVDVKSMSKIGPATAQGFFSVEELYDCHYNDDIIFWHIDYGISNDHFASIVPDDCVGAKIGGVMYESKTGEIQIGDETVSFKYVLTDLEHIDYKADNRLVALVDENGFPHTDFLNNLEEWIFNAYRKIFML